MADPGPDLRLDQASSLVSYGMRPRLITGLLLALLRQHFGDPANIEAPSIRDEPWAPTQPSGIYLGTTTRWDPTEANARPAVLVKQDEYKPQRVGIDDRLMGQLTDDGSSLYSHLVQGSHTLFAIATEDEETLALAEEVYRQLVQFRPVIQEKFRMKRCELASFGALHRLAADPAVGYAFPITLACCYVEGWTISPQAPYLKTILVSNVLNACR